MDAATTEAIAILLLIVLSALFSGMETALVSLSDVKLRARVEDGEELPHLLRRWIEVPNQVLAALLIGNNLVNITASALATHLTETLLRETPWSGWGIPIAVGVMTLLILVLGEVAPKTFAKHNPERYAKLLPALEPFWVVFYPATIVLVNLTRHVVEGMGGDLNRDTSAVTEEDIEQMVRIGKIAGSLDANASELLEGVLELDEKVAREIMVPRTDVHAVELGTPIEEVLEQVTRGGYSRYPVYRDSIDDVVGVVYAKDLMEAILKEGPEGIELHDVMREPMILPENMSVPDLLVAMKGARVHMCVIASEYGGVAGLVSLEDIVEEVFGDIYDEHDREQEPVRAVGDDTWLVEGVVTLSDLEDELGVPLEDEEEDYETVTGLLMKVAGRLPEPGYIHLHDGVRFEVLRSNPTRILEVAVRRMPPASPDTDAESEADPRLGESPEQPAR